MREFQFGTPGKIAGSLSSKIENNKSKDSINSLILSLKSYKKSAKKRVFHNFWKTKSNKITLKNLNIILQGKMKGKIPMLIVANKILKELSAKISILKILNSI